MSVIQCSIVIHNKNICLQKEKKKAVLFNFFHECLLKTVYKNNISSVYF